MPVQSSRRSLRSDLRVVAVIGAVMTTAAAVVVGAAIGVAAAAHLMNSLPYWFGSAVVAGAAIGSAPSLAARVILPPGGVPRGPAEPESGGDSLGQD